MQDQNAKKKNEYRLNILNKYQEIHESSSEWGRIEYRLQLSYANVSLQLKKIYSIGNSVNENKFMSRHQEKVMLEFIVSESQLKVPEDFTSVCEKGFQDIMNLSYGHLELQKFNKENEEYYEVLICRAAIGKTYIFPTKNITESIPLYEKPQLMTGQFDSLFIYDEQQISKDYIQKYIIYKSNQNILPLYIVHFSINQGKYRELREKVTCQMCQDDVAKKYCQTQDAYLCNSCDQIHHPHMNKVAHKHKRTDLSAKPKVISNCLIHTTIKLQLFCLQCNRPICVNCKIKGDHSSGQMLMHTLIRVTQKYNDTAKVLKEVDPMLDKKKKSLMSQVATAQAKLKDINRKSSEVQEQLYEIMQRALKQLQNITKNKMSLLMSDHIELKRQLDQIQWMERFIKYQYEVLSPNDFLLSWERHMSFRKLAISNTFQTNKILPDMKVQGFLNITTQQESRKGDLQKMQRNEEESQKIKTNLFRKNEQKTNYLLKTKVNYDEKDVQPTTIKSKNNFLNLSILKHI